VGDDGKGAAASDFSSGRHAKRIQRTERAPAARSKFQANYGCLPSNNCKRTELMQMKGIYTQEFLKESVEFQEQT